MMLSVKQGGIKYHFLSLCMTRPVIEPRSSRPQVNTLIGMPKSHLIMDAINPLHVFNKQSKID